MQSIAPKLFNLLRISPARSPSSSLVIGLQESSRAFFSTGSESDSGNVKDNDNDNYAAAGGSDENIGIDNDAAGGGFDEKIGIDNYAAAGGSDEKIGIEDNTSFHQERPPMTLQTVDPRKGWNFRGVHRAIICGKVDQAPVQKILRNGKSVTVFRVGTGGMYDQRIVPSSDSPKPAQWHRIAVHNPKLGAYAVQQIVRNSSVYVEGDIETRVYNDAINGTVKSMAEICVRHDGQVRVIKSGESTQSISFDELGLELP